jgi:uncharacterized membrane protein
MYWLFVAIPAVAAIVLSVYAKKRAQLAACGFLLLAVYAAVRMAIYVGEGLGFAKFMEATSALYVAAFWALVGAVVAVINGLSAKRE